LIGAHPRRKCPAVRRIGYTALMYAARNGHHEIVERLVAARADVNTKDKYGCALPRGPSGDLVGRRLCRLRLRRPGRWTALHLAAFYGRTKSAVALLVGGADQTVTHNQG
jgi:ankyrin repeat protein